MLLYHTSDLHNHSGIADGLRRLRHERPGFLFDCGDSLRGSQTVYHRHEPIIAELNAAGYDLQGMGNREFHYIFALLAARTRSMQYPLMCTNLTDLRGRILPFISERTFPLPNGRIMRCFSLLVPQYPVNSPWELFLGWRFLDPYEVAAEVAERAAADEVVVLLSHLGLEADRRLAVRVPRIDLILGGHSHDTLEEPMYIGRVPIIHAGPYGKFVSRTELDISVEQPKIREFSLVPLRGAA